MKTPMTTSRIESATFWLVIPKVIPSGVKLPGREEDHSPPTSVEVKNTWIHARNYSYIFMA
jgi:hypothetical protein